MDTAKAVATAIIGFTLLGVIVGGKNNNSPAPNATPVLQTYGSSCYTEGSFQKLEGQVTNISDRPLSNVEAVAIFKTSNGQFVKSDQAMLTYNPIMPGQTSPFLVITTGNPMISNCTVSFKTLFGGALAVK
ncbi:MAG TPA: FxLYD domain-containing protein [Pirellulales bacterium]|nr:FxLYD domain-containing protein [Pirellulales bacterium]